MSTQVAVDLPRFRIAVEWLKGQDRVRSQDLSHLWGGAGYEAFWQHQALDLFAQLTGRTAAEVIAALRAAADAAEAES